MPVDILLAIVAPLSALAGVYLGRRWKRTDEHEAWLRSRRIEAYVEVLDSSRALWAAFTGAFIEADGADELSPSEEQLRRLDQLTQEVERSATVVRLVGPKPVFEATGPLLAALATTYDSVVDTRRQLHVLREQWPLGTTPEGLAFLDAESRFVEAASAAVVT